MDNKEVYRSLITHYEKVNRSYAVLLTDNPPCDLIDEKPFEGTSTPDGDLCRIRAWTQYLIDVLACEKKGVGPDCCAKAAADYYSSWENCPA